MAIRPSNKYPSQTATDVAYPYGKARNQIVSGDGTGTPLEQDLVNDIFGFQQALLVAAAITPSDAPDTQTASQYLDAVRYVSTHPTGTGFFAFGIAAQDILAFGALDIGGAATFETTSRFVGGATFQTTSHFVGVATFDQPAAFNLGLSAFGPTALHGTTALSAAVTVSAEIILSTLGRIRQKVVYGPDLDHTYNEGDATRVVANALTAARNYTVNDAAADGAEFEFINWSSFTITVKNSSATPIATVAALSAGFPGRIKLMWHFDGGSTQWHQVSK
jgi:hypothetical protein